MKTIFVMGANPAWQKTLVFSALKTGEVNRAVSMEVYPAGKGVNVCRAAACFGTAETRLFQFAGGATGQRLCAALDELGIRHETVETRHETRTCVTCLDCAEGSMTELIEPSGAVSETEAEKFLQILKAHICEASVLVISGSLPDGTDPSLYRRVAEIAVAAGVPVIADAVKGIEAVLELPGRIILKVNREEFFKITGCSEIKSAHRMAAERWKNVSFAVTNGPDAATFSGGGRLFRYAIPRLEHVISPLGAGDTATAVFASCLLDGMAEAEAFRVALSAASANCLSARAGEFDPVEQRKILENLRCSDTGSLSVI